MIEPTQIAAVRRRLGLSQRELAQRSGVSQSLITKIEAGNIDPSYSKLKAISQVLERSTDHLKSVALDLMNRNLLKIEVDDTVEHAIELMTRHSVSQLLVFDGDALTGTVLESRLLEFVVRGENPESLQTRVREVMSEPLPQVPPDTSAEALVSLLNHFPAILVLAEGKIRGIVTKSDILSSPKIRRASPPTADSGLSKPRAPPEQVTRAP